MAVPPALQTLDKTPSIAPEKTAKKNRKPRFHAVSSATRKMAMEISFHGHFLG